MDRRAWGRDRTERGVAIVEAAVVMPLLMVVLFGIIEFGFAYNDYLGLRSAAREGARLAAVNNGCVGGAAASCGGAGAQRDDLIVDVRDKVGALSAQKDVAISVWLPEGTAVGKDVGISLSTRMRSRTGLFAPFINPITLEATAKMRLEQKPTFTAGTSCGDVAGTFQAKGPVPAC